MSSIIRTPIETDDEWLYPSSDGEPMGETDWHMMALIWLRLALEDHFADRADVKVASDMFLYYVKGDPSACTAPDIMVIQGVNKHWRRTFKTWIEKALPGVIIEIVSNRTWKEDVNEKRALYERLRVREYFIFDPEGCYITPSLQGFRLRGQRYVALPVAADGSRTSKELGLRLRAEDYKLRLIDVATGLPFLSPTERAAQAEQRANEEKQRADALEVELARLRAAQSRRKGKTD